MLEDSILLEDSAKPTLSFREYRVVNESFYNFLPKDVDKKKEHAEEIHAMLKKSYADQGGVSGDGFRSPDDMVKNIPMWKVAKKNGTIHAALMYKNSVGGRKLVAITTNGTPEGKKVAGDMLNADLKQKRANMEVSGKALSAMKHSVNVSDHIHSFEAAQKFHRDRGQEISRPKEDDPEVIRHPELKDHMYTRDIGGHQHTKVLLGYMGNKIV